MVTVTCQPCRPLVFPCKPRVVLSTQRLIKVLQASCLPLPAPSRSVHSTPHQSPAGHLPSPASSQSFCPLNASSKPCRPLAIPCQPRVVLSTQRLIIVLQASFLPLPAPSRYVHSTPHQSPAGLLPSPTSPESFCPLNASSKSCRPLVFPCQPRVVLSTQRLIKASCLPLPAPSRSVHSTSHHSPAGLFPSLASSESLCPLNASSKSCRPLAFPCQPRVVLSTRRLIKVLQSITFIYLPQVVLSTRGLKPFRPHHSPAVLLSFPPRSESSCSLEF
ncbi:hypothetical protein J6590_053026 [Homalodisca vitripennis]|nr:hypothetical protein J6590_053026 [Homalodisca vitripennis]